MKSKKPILKKILIVFVSFFGIIGLLLGGFFLKSNIFSNNLCMARPRYKQE